MARIYMNCPCVSSNGSSVYTIWRCIVFILIITFFMLLIVPIPQVFRMNDSSHTAKKEELHYGIVIDCGSSGSRVFVYVWSPHSGNPRDLLNITQLHDSDGNAVMKKVSPGLSSFEENPNAASDHIGELLHYVEEYIPKKSHPETVLYVMATAGMRMLSEKSQKAILLDLRTDIKKDFKFVAPENHFEVISGKQEGMFAWIAINYVLNRFSHTLPGKDEGVATVRIPQSDTSSGDPHSRKKTVGIIDMGGGSVQIAFEVTDPDHFKDIPIHLLSEFNLGCQDVDIEHTYRVYVTTFLGFGANSARDKYEQALATQASKAAHSVTDPLPDVCLPSGMQYESKDESGVAHHFIGTGDYDRCNQELAPLLNKTVPCTKPPCSVNGIHQPKIDLTTQFFGFSEFWYSMEDVLRMGGNYNSATFHNKAKEFCSTSGKTLDSWYKQNLYPNADDNRFRLQCFKSAWMVQMFHTGLSFPTDYDKFTSCNLVNGKDVGWTLGALIYKTRYLPLRDVERVKALMQSQPPSMWQGVTRLPDLHFLLFVCVLVVLIAIVFYMRWLRCCPRKSDLSRVPSMSYFMTDPNQMEQGIQYYKGQDYVL